MKKINLIIIILIILSINSCIYADSNIEKSKINTTNENNEKVMKRRVAYFTSWSTYEKNVNISDIDFGILTHLNFAFANLNQDGEILIGDRWADIEKPFEGDTWESNSEIKGHFNQLKKIKEKYPDIKTLISVGGWTWSNNFSIVASTEKGRETFAKTAVDFITKYGFDGIDIDWEFPVEGGNNIAHLKDDKYNYTKLVKKLRETLDKQEKKDNKKYLITIAGGANQSFIDNTEMLEMIKYLDFINVMTYDYHGGWENKTNHNTPLYSTENDESGSSVSNTIELYINSGIKPKDLNIGLAFYGRGWNNVLSKENNGLLQSGTAPDSAGYGYGTWEGSYFDYWDIAQNYVNKNNYKRYFDNKACVPYLYNGSTFISYEDEQSIKAKLNYAAEKELGGVMFWEFSGDKNKKLQNVIFNYDNNSNKEKYIEETTQTSTDTKINSIVNWNKDDIYTKGDIVLYNGKKYEAKWWTQGEIPNPEEEWNVWKPKI